MYNLTATLPDAPIFTELGTAEGKTRKASSGLSKELADDFWAYQESWKFQERPQGVQNHLPFICCWDFTACSIYFLQLWKIEDKGSKLHLNIRKDTLIDTSNQLNTTPKSFSWAVPWAKSSFQLKAWSEHWQPAPHSEHSALRGWLWRETQAGIWQMEIWMNLLIWRTC